MMEISRTKLIKILKLALIITAIAVFLLVVPPVFAEAESPAAEEPAASESESPPDEEPAGVEPADAASTEGSSESLHVEEDLHDEVPAQEEPCTEESSLDETAGEGPILEEPPVEASTDDLPADENQGDLIEEPVEETVISDDGADLVNAEGQPLDRASLESAELIDSGDPYFMVGADTYRFSEANDYCDINYPLDPYCFDGNTAAYPVTDAIQDALDYMSLNSILPSDRKLYVEGDTYNGFNVYGASSTQMALLDGVIGIDGSENTFINGDINVTDNTGGFTLQGFTLNSGSGIYFNDNSGTLLIKDVEVHNSNDYDAMQVINHSGPVVLEDVNISDNDRDGAYIANYIGSYPVTINNSAFNNNGWASGSSQTGLDIWSNNLVTINGTAACDNNGNGIYVNDYETLNISNAFLYSNHSPSSNYGVGLSAHTSGSGTATLENVYAYGNDYGIQINGGSLNAKYVEANDSQYHEGLYFYSDVGSSRIEYSNFHNNHYDGLYIENKGPIYLNSVQANQNGGAGAYLDNAFYDFGSASYVGTGAVTITSPSSGGPQMANSFNENGDRGVVIQSRGSVMISNVDMFGNQMYGLDINNTYGKGNVTMNATLKNWVNGFGYNNFTAVSIVSKGSVKLSDSQAGWNDGTGFYVQTTSDIQLINIWSESNIGNGASLYNDLAARAYVIKLTDSIFNNNQGHGIYIVGKGAIIANGLSASGNSIRDIYVGPATTVISYHDQLGDGSIEDIYTFNATAGQIVNLDLESEDFNGYLELYDPDGLLEASDNDSGSDWNASISSWSLLKNGTYTVVVKSFNLDPGNYWFSLNDLAHSNPTTYSYYGGYLVNTSGNGGVTIKKPKNLNNLWGNFFDMNSGYGLLIYSNGNINLDSLGANKNYYGGLNLDNPDSRGSVTVVNSRNDDFYSSFSGNDWIGMYIATLGNVTLKNIGAWANSSHGVYISNYQSGDGFGGVKILASANRSNDFGENGNSGLYVMTGGSIQLANIQVEHNDNNGVYLHNNYAGSSGKVTITTTGKTSWNNIIENNGYGIHINSNGAISLSRIHVEGNQADGAALNNNDSTSNPGITLKEATFSGNAWNGISAYTKGNFSWNSGGAYENNNSGAYIYNAYDGYSGSVSIAGSKKESMGFGNNGWGTGAGPQGLGVNSRGSITLKYAGAYNNNGNGFKLYNNNAVSNQKVDLVQVEAGGNVYTGIEVKSLGNIYAKGLRSQENGWYGAMLINDTGSGNVTVTTFKQWSEGWFNQNGWIGLYIESAGSVDMKNIHAQNNGDDGIYVDALDGNKPVTFVTTGRMFTIAQNGGMGLFIGCNGSITVKNQFGLNVSGNHGSNGGLYLDNDGAPVSSYVRVYKVLANENDGGKGIYIEAAGTIYVSSLTVQHNATTGADLWSYNGSINIVGSNLFQDNGQYGLHAYGEGDISISNATAWNNGFEGINLYSTAGSISASNIKTAHNQGSGLLMECDGNFTVEKVTAFLNGQSDSGGLWDDGLGISTGNLASTVSIKNSTFMTNWWGSGIEIDHPDPNFLPSLSNVNYLSNGGPDLYIHT